MADNLSYVLGKLTATWRFGEKNQMNLIMKKCLWEIGAAFALVGG